ncbi:MAG: alpha/beta hydrolase family protein [Edafosvirus sp.]|uniref:Alpha/beta hydrolase family protein n=1 Tax=Edafosvirus sp. TaxID=2487765 RepID=A0A3G4ZU19_9VIRU|nr:MAG: alpha/beta hydrolase family protein [Edafosvirus sp.]
MGSSSSCCNGRSKCCRIESILSLDLQMKELVFPAPKNKQEIVQLKDDLIFIYSINAIIITPQIKKSDKYIIFSHGNGSNVSTHHNYLKSFSNEFGVTVICYDYPGYGLTEGEPSEDSCFESLVTIIEYVSKLTDSKNIILMGHSLGTAVIIDYVSKNKWTNPVILISPFKSIPEVYSKFHIIVYLTKKYRFDSGSKLKNVICPVKIFHGEEDKIVNISHGKYLYEHLNNKILAPIWMPLVGHNDVLEKICPFDIMEILSYK